MQTTVPLHCTHVTCFLFAVGPWELGVCACKSKGDELITIREDGDLEDLLRRGRHAIPEIFEREGGTTIVWLGATDGEQEGVWKTAKDGSILPEAMEPEGNTDKFNCAAIKDGEAHKAWGCWDETGVILCDDDI